MNRYDLIAALGAIASLEERGATSGERDAARRARLRLESRLDQLEEEPGAHATELALARHHVTAAGAETTVDRSPATAAPSPADIRAWVEAWRTGRVDEQRIRRWARRTVDRHVLPQQHDSEPGVRAAEVVMALAGGLPVVPDAALAFVDAPPHLADAAWQAWLAHLAYGVG